MGHNEEQVDNAGGSATHAAVSASVAERRVFKVPRIAKKDWEIPIALVTRGDLPKKGEFRRTGNDIIVNGTWLAYSWAIKDANEPAKEAILKLLQNWPFDFKQYAGQKEEADTLVFKDVVNRPGEVEHQRDYFGLDSRDYMNIIAAIRDF